MVSLGLYLDLRHLRRRLPFQKDLLLDHMILESGWRKDGLHSLTHRWSCLIINMVPIIITTMLMEYRGLQSANSRLDVDERHTEDG